MKIIAFIKSLFRRRRPVETLPDLPLRRWDVRCYSKRGMHRMSCVEWGDSANPRVLVCAHGLTRNARDFDNLAQAMSPHYRVICPDVVGRGHSDWLAGKLDYQVPQYALDMILMLRHLRVKRVDWVGTSMGGLIGMGLASQRPDLIGKLVLNDVGPVITATSLQRIGQYVGHAPDFDSLTAAEAYIRAVSPGFGPLTDAQWQHLAEHSVQQIDGVWRMRYDPGIGASFQHPPTADIEVWPVYDAIKAPTLVIRGAESDLLRADTVAKMAQRGPRAKVVEIAGVGHAPVLMDDAQIAIVQDFLLQGPA